MNDRPSRRWSSSVTRSGRHASTAIRAWWAAPVKLGTATATIVGVMPEGFGFPVNERIWTPLRVDGSVLAPRTGPCVSIFGRLAPGASMDDARAELGVIGARMSASNPETHKHLRPRVTPYAKPLAEGGRGGSWSGTSCTS